MTSAVGLENEHLGSHHFDAIREQDEAEALEEVRLKEKELEAEAMHAFDDLLDHSGSEASSYYKPPASHIEGQNAESRNLKNHIECLRVDNQRLIKENELLKTQLTAAVNGQSECRKELEKAEVRIGLLEQELNEVTDAQTIHRVKDQYEAILEKLKIGFNREKAEIVQQLTKYKDEAFKARDHVCPKNEEPVFEKQKLLEGELNALRDTVDDLRRKELELQLMVKDQSMLLKERESPDSLCEYLGNLCDILDVARKDCPQATLSTCVHQVSDLKSDLKRVSNELSKQSSLCDSLKVTATALEKENHALKERTDQNNSDTESHSENTRMMTLKMVIERLEEENLRLRLRAQTADEAHQRLQTETKNRLNDEARKASSVQEITEVNRKLLADLKGAREFAIECRRAQEMMVETLEKTKANFEQEKQILVRDLEMSLKQKWQTETDRLKSQLEEEVTRRNSIVGKLRATCGEMLESRLTKICQEKDAEIQRITDRAAEEKESMHERLTVLQEDIEELRKEASVSKKVIADLRAKLQKTEYELEDAKYALESKTEKIQRLESKTDDFKLEREAEIGKLADMEKKIKFLENLVKTSKLRVEKINKEKDTIATEKQKELRGCLLKFEAVTKRCEILENELARQKADVQATGDGMLQATCERLVRELEETRLKQSEAAEEIEGFRAQLAAKYAAMKKVREDLVDFHDRGRRYQAERRELTQLIDRQRMEIERRRLRNSDLSDAIAAIADKVILRLLNPNRL